MLLRNFVSRLYENLKVQTDYPHFVSEIENGGVRQMLPQWKHPILRDVYMAL
jgi:hypothetical protein